MAATVRSPLLRSPSWVVLVMKRRSGNVEFPPSGGSRSCSLAPAQPSDGASKRCLSGVTASLAGGVAQSTPWAVSAVLFLMVILNSPVEPAYPETYSGQQSSSIGSFTSRPFRSDSTVPSIDSAVWIW